VAGPSVVLIKEQQPQPESDNAEPVRPWSWPGSPPAGVGLGELFAGLAAWKSGAPRDAVDPAAPAAVKSAAGDGAVGSTAGEGSVESTAGEGAAGGTAAEDAGGSMLDWLAVAVSAAEKALGEPAWRHGDDGLAAAMSLIGRLRCALERVEVAVAGEVVQRGSANANGCSTIDWLVAAAGSSAPRPEVQHVTSVLRVAQGCSGQAPAGESFAQAFRSGAMPLAKAEQVARFVSDVAAVAEPETLAADVAALVAAASDDHRGLPGRAAED